MTMSSRVRHAVLGITLVCVAATAAAQAPVEVVRVTSKSVERQVKLPGEFQPYLTAPIYAKLVGFVKRVALDRESTVKQSQVLVTLETPENQDETVQAAA